MLFIVIMIKKLFLFVKKNYLYYGIKLYNFIESAPVFFIQITVLDSFRDMVAGDIFLSFQVGYGMSNF